MCKRDKDILNDLKNQIRLVKNSSDKANEILSKSGIYTKSGNLKGIYK
jgi:hypothetical protein